MRLTLPVGVLLCGLILAQTSSVGAIAQQKQPNQNNVETASNTVVKLLSTESTKALVVITDAVTEPVVEQTPVEPVETKHMVQESENLSIIAKQYSLEWKKIYDKNTSIENPDLIEVGTELVIPTVAEVVATRELPAEPVAAPPAPATTAQTTKTSKRTTQQAAPTVQAARGASSGNGYVAGYCTWYVKSRRPDLPNNLGNARTWVARAAAQGIATGSEPRVGAAAQRGNHIAYVESVNGDGTITITDMNYQALYAITNRTVPANQWSYIY